MRRSKVLCALRICSPEASSLLYRLSPNPCVSLVVVNVRHQVTSQCRLQGTFVHVLGQVITELVFVFTGRDADLQVPARMLTSSGSTISISMASSLLSQRVNALGLLVQRFVDVGCHVFLSSTRIFDGEKSWSSFSSVSKLMKPPCLKRSSACVGRVHVVIVLPNWERRHFFNHFPCPACVGCPDHT
jgi:hypothetical protein